MRFSRTYPPLEFLVRWTERTDEFLPPPMHYIGEPITRREFHDRRRAVRDAVHARPDPAAEELLDALTRPDIRIMARGGAPEGAADVRVLAVRTADRGYVVRQLPSETPWQSEGYEVTDCAAIELAEVVAAILPEAPAGRLGDLALPMARTEADLDYSYRRSRVADSFDDQVEVRALNFTRATRTHSGAITVEQGHSKFGPRGITRHTIEWADLEDDGRYAVVDSGQPMALAAGESRLVRLINDRVAEVVRAIKDERRT